MNELISKIAFKVLIGLLLFVGVVIALSSLSNDLHTYLGKFENGELLRVAVYGFLLIASASGLLVLFRYQQPEKEFAQDKGLVSPRLSLDFHTLGVEFFDGFISGFVKQSDKKAKFE